MKNLIALVAMTVLLVSCGGGNGGGAPSLGLNHKELAQEFVTALNATGNYNVELTKKSTLQYDHVVVYDRTLKQYDAYYIGDWKPGQDVVNYVDTLSNNFYYDLRRIPGHWITVEDYGSYYDYYTGQYEFGWHWEDEYVPTRYRDRRTGLLFEKVQATGKDLEKIAAFKEGLQIKNSADLLAGEFGLSQSRAKEVARLAVQWDKNQDSMTDADHDAFSTEVLGVSITDAKEAFKKSLEGDSKSLEAVIEQAAATNDIAPEDMQEIFSGFLAQ